MPKILKAGASGGKVKKKVKNLKNKINSKIFFKKTNTN